MLTFLGKGTAHTCDGVTRRDFLQAGTLGALGLYTLSELLSLEARSRCVAEVQIAGLTSRAGIHSNISELRVIVRERLLEGDAAAKVRKRSDFEAAKRESRQLLGAYEDSFISDERDRRLLGERTTPWLRYTHLVSTLLTLAASIPHIVIAWLRRRAEFSQAAGAWLRVSTALSLVGLCAVAALTFAYSGTKYRNEFPSDYSFLYGKDKPFAPSLARTATNGAFDPRTMAGSGTCGSSGCATVDSTTCAFAPG